MDDPFNIDMNVPKVMKRRVNKIVAAHVTEFPLELKQWGDELLEENWQFHIADQDTGWCNVAMRTIILPKWVIVGRAQAKQEGYKTWYLAHEMAHAFDRCVHIHGPEFMEWLIRICPEPFLKYELGYKPWHAARAGITMNGLKR